MDRDLTGRCILVVEDQPLVMIDIAGALRSAGADVLTATALQEALPLAEHPHLSVAIIDFGLGDSDSSALCARLNARGLPFIIYTGYDISQMHDECRAGVFVSKPASRDTLINAVVHLLERK